MISRERLRCALEHREADSVPVDFGAMRSTGISAVAYGKLRTYLNLPERPFKVYDVIQQLAEPDEDVVNRLQADVVQLHRLCTVPGIPNNEWRGGQLEDGTPCLFPRNYSPWMNEKGEKHLLLDGAVYAKMPVGGMYYDRVFHPYQDASTIDDIDKIPMALISDYELEYLQRRAEQLYRTTDYGILGAFGGGIFEVGQGDFGFEQYFNNLAMEPRLIHHYNRKLCRTYLHDLEKYLIAVGQYIDVIQFGDDLGTQNSQQISVQMYRQLIKPYQAELYSYVKKHFPHVKVFLHSCGAITPMLPDLIDAGVEVINPVQLSAAGMDANMLKREFGEELTFWGGGISTQTTLVSGSVEEVENSVRENIRIFAPGGGFVFTQDHNIQPDIPPETILAVYEAANVCRSYSGRM